MVTTQPRPTPSHNVKVAWDGRYKKKKPGKGPGSERCRKPLLAVVPLQGAIDVFFEVLPGLDQDGRHEPHSLE